MPSRRIAVLAFAADVTAVIVFAAVGRSMHGASDELFALFGTATPFLVGLVAAWATPTVRALPTGLLGGTVALAGSAGIGLVLRAGFTGELPLLVFAVIAVVSLALLLLGWRTLSLVVAHRAGQQVP